MTAATLAPAPRPGVKPAQVEILFFGRVADVFGRRIMMALPAKGCSVAELRRRLSMRGPQEAHALARPDVRVAVDQSIADPQTRITPGQEVAFFSMFSGG